MCTVAVPSPLCEPWGSGYARALDEKREALAYHERELAKIRAQRAEWGKGSAARAGLIEAANGVFAIQRVVVL